MSLYAAEIGNASGLYTNELKLVAWKYVCDKCGFTLETPNHIKDALCNHCVNEFLKEHCGIMREITE